MTWYFYEVNYTEEVIIDYIYTNTHCHTFIDTHKIVISPAMDTFVLMYSSRWPKSQSRVQRIYSATI